MMGLSGFDSRRGLGTCLFDTVSRLIEKPTQPSIQWGREVSFPGSKEAGA
jgi:hypothetical protein